MKILLLDHPQFTHSTWMLYEGIVRIFGRDSITIFPPKPSFYGNPPSTVIRLIDIRWYRDIFKTLPNLPKGIPPLAPGESLTTNDECDVDYLNVIPKLPDRSYQDSIDEDELIELINNGFYDCIILGNSHRVPTIALARLRDRCRQLPPIIYYDAGERDEFNAHWWHVFRPALTFKSVITPELMSHIGTPSVPCEMFPLPLSHPSLLIDPVYSSTDDNFFSDRDIDIISSFGPTWPSRLLVQQTVEQFCSRMSQELSRPFNAILNGYEIYQLSHTKVAVSMRGSGRDTERYWEFPARGVAMLCDGTMGVIHPFPFKDKETAVFYSNINELNDGLKFLLEDESRRQLIAKAGFEHVRKYHSIEGRALFFIGIIREQLGLCLTLEQTLKLEIWREQLGWNSFLPEWRGMVVGYDES